MSASATIEDERPEFWAGFAHDDLALRCAVLHAQRRQWQAQQLDGEIGAVRRAVAAMCIHGNGIEVGAGSRPFPLPDGAHCYYGDVRTHEELSTYFGTSDVALCGEIDAQTMQGVPAASLDFVISAHVIEHLFDPLGAIEAALGVLRPGGTLLLVAPEMTRTWDRERPPTPLAHVIGDHADGGEGTRLQAYLEHVRHVHPVLTGETIAEDRVEENARAIMASGMDIHVHAWRLEDIRQMLDYAAQRFGARVDYQLDSVNENLFVLQRTH